MSKPSQPRNRLWPNKWGKQVHPYVSPCLSLEKGLLTALLLLALISRIYVSFYYTHSPDPDVPINALMVKHVAEGRHFPTIYYNESYVGTGGAYLGALLKRLIPLPVTPALLGYAWVSFLALPFFYLWARKTAGNTAALFGLALLVVGPVEFGFRNTFIGYPGALLCGMIACWLTLRILEADGENPPPARDLFLLGLVAGIGWWTQAIVLDYLLPCALVLALSVSWRHWFRAGTVAIAGLLIGASPWILFTLREATALAFVTNVSTSTEGMFFRNIQTAFSMFVSLYRESATPSHWTGLATAGMVLLSVVSLAAGAGNRKEILPRALPWLMIASTLLLCGVSNRFAHVPAARYLLPLVPAFALLAGIGLAWLISQRSRVYKVMGVSLFMLLMIGDICHIPPIHSAYRDSRLSERKERLQGLESLHKQGEVDILHGDFFKNWITLFSEERLPVSTFPDRFDRYRPYRGHASLSDRPGVLDDYRGFSAFLKDTGAQARTATFAGLSVAWEPRRTHRSHTYLSSEQILSIDWENGESASELMDRNLDTPLSLSHIEHTRFEVTDRKVRIRFREPLVVRGIYAWGPSGSWRSLGGVTAHLEGKEEVQLIDKGRPSGWFWSNGRPYLAGHLAHYASRFPDTLADELVIRVQSKKESLEPLVSELRILIAEETKEPDLDAAFNELAERLRANSPTRLYAPRWVAEEARVLLPGIPGILPSDLYEQYEGRDRYPAYPIVRVETVGSPTLVVPAASANETRRNLQENGWILLSETSIGPWVGIQAKAGPDTPSPSTLYWTEQGVFLAHNWYPEKPKLTDFFPLLRQPVTFDGGAVLHTVAVDRKTQGPGKHIQVVFEWFCPPGVHPQNYAVFAHFRQQDVTRFQDDHVWFPELTREATRIQPENWTFREVRQLSLPENAPPGTYTLHIGLYDPRTGKRLKPKGSDQVQGRAVEIEDVFRIETTP